MTLNNSIKPITTDDIASSSSDLLQFLKKRSLKYDGSPTNMYFYKGSPKNIYLHKRSPKKNIRL